MTEEGEFQKRIKEKRYHDGRFMTIEEAISKKDVADIVGEAEKELFDAFRRGLIHSELVKWFGKAHADSK